MQRRSWRGAALHASDTEPQSLAAALPDGDAQTLYQQGYGALLQKDYAGAEVAFQQSGRAPIRTIRWRRNAQYWIGETYYVRGQYKNAADAFLKGYKKYKSGDKAPDTLLRLGMALAELGQKDAACSTLNELKTKYPERAGAYPRRGQRLAQEGRLLTCSALADHARSRRERCSRR